MINKTRLAEVADALHTVAEQVLRDMEAQGLLIEWQTTLREALAQHAERQIAADALPPLPEPTQHTPPHSRNFVGFVNAYTADQMRAYARAALAQHAERHGEAAGVVGTQKGGVHWTITTETGKALHAVSEDALTPMLFKVLPLGTLLYAAPPPREPVQPLSEEQVFNNNEFMHLNGSLLQLAMPQLMLLVRAIERAHGITERSAAKETK
jgi:hypothetical protein